MQKGCSMPEASHTPIGKLELGEASLVNVAIRLRDWNERLLGVCTPEAHRLTGVRRIKIC
jgi:hypothetical protein